MFIGHFAVGFASKRLAPRTSLGALMAAPLLLDLLWPIALWTGLESVTIDPGNTVVTPLDLHNYPYTHSLLMSVVWSVLFGVGYVALSARGGLLRTERLRGGWVIAAGVFSHFILDFVTHRPDMPLYPGSTTYVGLGLWNSKPWTMMIESCIFILGTSVYLRMTKALDRTGKGALAALVALLVVFYLGNMFGPPPTSVAPIKVLGLAMWLFVPWAAWIDRHRAPRNVDRPEPASVSN